MRQDWKSVGTYGTVGLEFALSLLLPLGGGRWLDRHLGTAPWLALLGAALGLAAGVRAVWRALQRANREADEQSRLDRGDHE